MTYLQFHLVFTVPLFILALGINIKNPFAFSQRSLIGTLTLAGLALFYTTPWDSYLIQQSIWAYNPGNVLGSFLHIPYEEYFFFLIQTVIACLFLAYLLRPDKVGPLQSMQIRYSTLILFGIFLVALALLFAVTPMSGPYRYLNLILFWATPILGLQWFLGAKTLLLYHRTFLTALIPLTLYFWFADSVAISQKIWFFPEESISGIQLFGILPIEEALFFLVTNMMVVQGYILFTQVDLGKIKVLGGSR